MNEFFEVNRFHPPAEPLFTVARSNGSWTEDGCVEGLSAIITGDDLSPQNAGGIGIVKYVEDPVLYVTGPLNPDAKPSVTCTVYTDLDDAGAGPVMFSKNWLGDQFHTFPWIWCNQMMSCFTVTSNAFQAGGRAIVFNNGTRGLFVAGNDFDTLHEAIYFLDGTRGGIAILGNRCSGTNLVLTNPELFGPGTLSLHQIFMVGNSTTTPQSAVDLDPASRRMSVRNAGLWVKPAYPMRQDGPMNALTSAAIWLRQPQGLVAS